jgi:probable selenium-dependent hydroxylase accessory protein YqeC
MEEIWSQLILKEKVSQVITIIGGGGKTRLMYYLLGLVQKLHYLGIATTTTKLSSEVGSGHCFIEVKSLVDAYLAMEEIQVIKEVATLVYGPDPLAPSKMLGIPKEWIDELAAKCPEMIFVVEGDGSAGKSVKGHLAHEPVIPEGSSMVIVVIGIDSVGAFLNGQQVHRPARMKELVPSLEKSVVTTERITQLIFHPQGYLHNCPPHSEIIFFINKVESEEQQKQAEELAQQLLAYHHERVGGVVIGSLLKEEGRWLQA